MNLRLAVVWIWFGYGLDLAWIWFEPGLDLGVSNEDIKQHPNEPGNVNSPGRAGLGLDLG